MLERFVSVTKAVASQVQAAIAEQAPTLAQELDLPQRQRFVELLARGFDAFVHGLERATREAEERSRAATAMQPPGRIMLGPRPLQPELSSSEQAARGHDPAAAAVPESAGADEADDEAFARKFAQLFLDMGGIFPKLAQVLSLRPDIIKNRRVLLRLRAVQEECRRMPFEEARALVLAESAAFREGRYQLKDWPRYVHAGSIAQVAPFVDCEAQAVGVDQRDVTPDGIAKLTFQHMREVMEVDFRLLRSQLHWMERTGQWTQAAPGLAALRPKAVTKLREVWRVMVGMEEEVLREFDLRHEAECQQRGSVVLEGLLGLKQEACAWLEEWRDSALEVALRPAGPRVADQVREAWRGGAPGPRPAGGWLRRLARRAYAGRAAADELAEGEKQLAILRAALRGLRVQVPPVYSEASGPHVLVMALAEGRSLKEVLDVVAEGGVSEAAQKAAAWFAALLLFVVVPIWGKALLVVGCCHADPHPGNFKVSGIPGLEEAVEQAVSPTPARPGLLGRLGFSGAAPSEPHEEAAALRLWVLDWGSCVELEEGMRQTLCRLVLGLAALRAAERPANEPGASAAASRAVAEATQTVAACIRTLGLQSEDDEFLAALGMALFDPAVASHHPKLSDGRAEEELGRGFPAGSNVGKVLRVVAILVGICRELEARMNEEAAGRQSASSMEQQPFVELFLVELWRPFAEEGLA